MNLLRHTISAGALAIALTVASQAHANLILTVAGSPVANDATNTSVGVTNLTSGNWSITVLGANGVNSFGGSGELLDLATLEVNSTGGAGSLQILVTETGLNLGSGTFVFNLDFSASLTNISATRSIFLDAGNGANVETTLLGSTTGSNLLVASLPQGLTGPFSLTEEIDLTANAAGAKLSSDDSVKVPEPGSLALLGAGLVGFGWFARRRRKAA